VDVGGRGRGGLFDLAGWGRGCFVDWRNHPERTVNITSTVTQYTIACCSVQVVDITLTKYRFANITSLRVV
jgi:hypothetical protein